MRKIIFTKYSDERSEEFAVKTVITTENGLKTVGKYPISEKAAAHVDKKEKKREKIDSIYAKAELKAAPCRKNDGGVEFDYIEGSTFEEMLEECERNSGYEAMLAMFEKFKDKLMSISTNEFVRTDEFDEVFGKTKLPSGLHSMDFCCFDLAFGNLIIDSGNSEHIIDYEWCFDFPVPSEYIFYRAVKLYTVISGRNDLIDKGIYNTLATDAGLAKAFDSLEDSFQAYIRKKTVSLCDLYESFDKKNYNIGEIFGMYKKEERYTQIFFDKGNEFVEENSYRVDIQDIASLKITINDGVKACRIDPLNKCCTVMIKKLKAYVGNREYVPDFAANAERTEAVLYFGCDDPIMAFEKLEEGTDMVELEYAVLDYNKEQAEEAVRNYSEKISKTAEANELENRLKIMTEQFETMRELAEERLGAIERIQTHVQNITANLDAERDGLNAVIAERENYISEREQQGMESCC